MLCLFVLVTSFLLLFSQGAVTDEADGRSMFEVTKSIVESRSLAVDARYGFPGVGGRYYASHGIGLPLAGIVPYLAARPLERYTGLGASGTEAVVASCMPLIAGLLVLAVYRLARILGADIQSAMLVSAGAVCGTYLLAFSKEYFGEPLATLFVVLSMSAAISRRPALSGTAAAAAALTRPPLFAFAPVLVWQVWREDGWQAAVKATVPVIAGVAVALGYNAARFGDPLQFGYEGLGFTTPLLHGLSGVLFHPEKSVFLFAPIVVLVPFGLYYVFRTSRSAFWLIAGQLVLTLVISVKWIDWYGGWTWGPRTLLPGIIPAVVPLAPWATADRLRRRAVVFLLLFGFLVSAPTLLVSQRAQLMDRPPAYGPSVERQAGLVPRTVQFTFDRLVSGACDRGRYEAYVNTWQVQLVCRSGQRGFWLAALLSLMLAGAAVGSARIIWTTVSPPAARFERLAVGSA